MKPTSHVGKCRTCLVTFNVVMLYNMKLGQLDPRREACQKHVNGLYEADTYEL